MRLPLQMAAVVFLAACSSESVPARSAPDAAPSVRWSPKPMAVRLSGEATGEYRGCFRMRDRDFEVLVHPGDAQRPPRIVIPDCGDGTVGTLTGNTDCSDFTVDGVLRLHPDSSALHVALDAEGAVGAATTLRVLVTECPTFDVELGGRTFRGLLIDHNSDGRFDDFNATRVVFDRDGDGEHDDDDEGYDASEAFDLGTGAFRVRRIAADGANVVFESSWRSPGARAFVGRGDTAPGLPNESIDGGAAIDLAALRGQRVLLLFWFPT